MHASLPHRLRSPATRAVARANQTHSDRPALLATLACILDTRLTGAWRPRGGAHLPVIQLLLVLLCDRVEESLRRAPIRLRLVLLQRLQQTLYGRLVGPLLHARRQSSARTACQASQPLLPRSDAACVATGGAHADQHSQPRHTLAAAALVSAPEATARHQDVLVRSTPQQTLPPHRCALHPEPRTARACCVLRTTGIRSMLAQHTTPQDSHRDR